MNNPVMPRAARLPVRPLGVRAAALPAPRAGGVLQGRPREPQQLAFDFRPIAAQSR